MDLQEPEEHGRVVSLIDEYRGERTELKTVGPYQCNRILGQQRSLAQYSGKPVEHARGELGVTVPRTSHGCGRGMIVICGRCWRSC